MTITELARKELKSIFPLRTLTEAAARRRYRKVYGRDEKNIGERGNAAVFDKRGSGLPVKDHPAAVSAGNLPGFGGREYYVASGRQHPSSSDLKDGARKIIGFSPVGSWICR